MIAKLLNYFIPPKSVSPPFWISDNGNTGGFDGEVVGHYAGEKLPAGTYWVRDIGTRKSYRKHFKDPLP